MEIICKGYVSREFYNAPLKASVGYSDIFDFLIREVGTKVTHYASDLYYDLKAIENAITRENPVNASFLIGLREMGVDSSDFIKARLDRPDIYGTPYINIYSVDIKVDENEREIVVVLSTVQ